MKKVITLSAFYFLMFSVHSYAQNATADSTRHHQKTTKTKPGKTDVSSQLGLSNEQSQKLNQYNKEAKQKKNAVKNDSTLTSTQKSQQLKALKREKEKNVSSVLTKDQQTKMKALKNQQKTKNKLPASGDSTHT